jgi:hypothetical protein
MPSNPIQDMLSLHSLRLRLAVSVPARVVLQEALPLPSRTILHLIPDRLTSPARRRPLTSNRMH